MTRVLRGRAWRLGDNVSTDHIISGKYKFAHIDDLGKMLPHVLEEVIPGFYRLVNPGDVIVAGRNFGMGSSREQAPRLLKMLGVSAIVAKSFARIFLRNAINLGLPVVQAPKVVDVTETGDVLVVDLAEGLVLNESRGVRERFPPYPELLLEVMVEGGIANYVRSRGGLPPAFRYDVEEPR